VVTLPAGMPKVQKIGENIMCSLVQNAIVMEMNKNTILDD
jgi:hypothetical protein